MHSLHFILVTFVLFILTLQFTLICTQSQSSDALGATSAPADSYEYDIETSAHDARNAEVELPSSATSSQYNLLPHSTPAAALQSYAEWANRTLTSANECSNAQVIVWSATAGFGDSVNALTTAFRYALATSRLFFIHWSSLNHPQLWKIGLEEPDWRWDWLDAATAEMQKKCGWTKEMFEDAMRPQYYRQRSSTSTTLPRIISIRGSMTSDHPLASSLDSFYKSGRNNILSQLTDARLQDFLLRPNAVLQAQMKSVVKQLRIKRLKRFDAVIGIQVRTGYADESDEKKRPKNANFLQKGDEKLFLSKFLELYESDRFQSDPERVRVFLMTDSPEVKEYLFEEIQRKRGVRVVTVEDSTSDNTPTPAAHCGPHTHVTSSSVLRMLTDWFTFKRATDLQIITAWSLFGSSACEGKEERYIYRIDASNCGEEDAKPCQNSRR